MNGKTCTEIQASFSDYLDGAVAGHEMLEISRHIEGADPAADQGCNDCARELAAWRLTQSALASLSPAKAPADLALKLRIAISQEQAKRKSRIVDSLSLAWDNAVRPMLLQVTAGFASAIVLVGTILFLLDVVGAPKAVLANDEPLGAITAPHFLYSTVSPGDTVDTHGTPVVVEASVDSRGRVYDYTIVSGPQDDTVRNQVANQLLSSIFQPASAFGVPVRGRVVITFAGISVRG